MITDINSEDRLVQQTFAAQTQLAQIVQQTLAAMQSDGTLAALKEKWFGVAGRDSQ